MKTFVLFCLILMQSALLHATEQEPDFIHYKGLKLSLSTGWGHPSPLETYYTQNGIEYPFTMLHTANYRGHVATWEISDDKLFLKTIQINKKKYKPEDFKVKSETDSLVYHDKVFADWFSGVIIGEKRKKKNSWEVEKSYYFYIRYGKLVNTQELSDKDYKQIETISEKDTSNHELMDKYSMLHLNNNYISYYFRIHGKDTITFDVKGGYLSGNSGLSPVLAYYSNDHLKWPYNWENFEKSGAPFCTWKIDNDSLILTNIELHTGTGFYSIDKFDVDLVELFPNLIKANGVFGNWVSGIFIVSHGENKEDKNLPGYVEFKASEYTYMRLQEGMVLEKYTVPAGFDIDNTKLEVDEGLRQIFKELN